MSETFVIIGAGQAGCQAAATLRSEHFTGDIVMIGDEAQPPYQRPPLSKKYLMGELAAPRLELRPRKFYDDQNVTLKLATRALSIDTRAHRITLSDGTSQPYTKVLLATGTRARPLAIPGADLTGIFYLRTLADVDQLRPQVAPGKRVVLLGGGFIGLEVAAVAAKLGCAVTVVEMAPRLMGRAVSDVVSKFYLDEHRKAGVTVYLDTASVAIEGANGAATGVKLSTGDTVPADIVLVGIGALPNDELAKAAGIACGNGIMVDEFGCTSDPDVFAAGDCADHPNPFAKGRFRLESVQNAIDQAKYAAKAMMGNKIAYHEVPWFWSDQYDLKLQMAGLAIGYDMTVQRGSTDARSFSVFYLENGRVIAVETVNAIPEYMIGRKLIAAKTHVDPEKLADPGVPIKTLAEG